MNTIIKKQMERIMAYESDSTVIDLYLDKVLDKVDVNLDHFSDGFASTSTGNRYKKIENTYWTTSFYIGIAWAAYAITGDKKFLRNNEFYFDSFKKRIDDRIETDTHDLGFLYSLSCVAEYKMTGNEAAKEVAVEAADLLMERYNDGVDGILACCPMDAGVPYIRIIIDTMMNLPLLFWASEVTGDSKYYDAAYQHAKLASTTLVREDASVFHTYLFDPVSGRAIEGKTSQGKFDQSTWARGQAWCVYGYALAYGYTKDEDFLTLAKRAAEYYVGNLPEDFIHYWDFSVTDLEPEMKDSSAASIGLCGFMEIAKYCVDPEEKAFYEKTASVMLEQLCRHYYIDSKEAGVGFLREGYYGHSKYDECSSWGDYYFVEAFMKLSKSDISFW